MPKKPMMPEGTGKAKTMMPEYTHMGPGGKVAKEPMPKGKPTMPAPMPMGAMVIMMGKKPPKGGKKGRGC